MAPSQANDMGPSQKKDSSDDLREEERLEESLEQLKALHIKLITLRTAIPRMIDSLTATRQSPDAFVSNFKKSVAAAGKELSEFKNAMTSVESKKLFDETDASRQKTPKGIRPWRATDDPNWTTLSLRHRKT